MKITFTLWSADEIIQAYLDFVKKKKSKEVFIQYSSSNREGFSESMKGKLEITNARLKNLPQKIQYENIVHSVKLFQKNWRVTFSLSLLKDDENDYRNIAVLTFDKSLHKEVYSHFKKFGSETLSK